MNDRGGRGYVDCTRGTRPLSALTTHSAFAWSKEGSGKVRRDLILKHAGKLACIRHIRSI